MAACDPREPKICCDCNQSGTGGSMIETSDAHYHGRCFIRSFGVEQLLAMPGAELRKLTIGDVGITVIRQIMAAETRGYRGVARPHCA